MQVILVDLDTKSVNNTITNNYLVGKEGSGNDGVNNSKKQYCQQ